MTGRIECIRAAEIIEAAVHRGGPLVLDVEQRRAVIGCTLTVALQAIELARAGHMPVAPGVLIMAASREALLRLGLTDGDVRAVLAAADRDTGAAP